MKSAATVHEQQPMSPTVADKKKKEKKEKENATQNADVRFIAIQMLTKCSTLMMCVVFKF